MFMFQKAYIHYILGEVPDLKITVETLPDSGLRDGLKLVVKHRSHEAFRNGCDMLSKLSNNVCSII